MKRSYLYCISVLLALSVAGTYSCKKVNGINNNNVVETPYSLYFSDTSGTLFVSTDGKTINKIVFPPDGKPMRSLLTSGDNLLFAKNNLYVSNNNGENFNNTLSQLTSINYFDYVPGGGIGGPASYTINGMQVDLNQSMLINLPTWGNRVYATTNAATDANGNTNYMGVFYSDNNGSLGSWATDSYDTSIPPASIHGILPVRMTSLTQLVNGYVCGVAYEPPQTVAALSISNHIRYVRNFYKPAKPDVNGTKWKEVTSNPDNVTSIRLPSIGSKPLPPSTALGLTDTSFFTLGHYNNRLIAIDQKGEYGAWYSDDYGTNWTKYAGLPAKIPLLCISAPFEEVCLIGTDSAGLYILNVNTGQWQPNNNGLSSNLVVRDIAFKETIYKNNTVKKYVYIATSEGIFQSVDDGINWVKTIPGNYTAVY